MFHLDNNDLFYQGDHAIYLNLIDCSCAGGLSRDLHIMILEGYFAFSPEFYKDKTGFYLAEVCKFLLPCSVYDNCPTF